MKSQKWRDKLADKTLTLNDFESALDEWDDEVEGLEAEITEAEAETTNVLERTEKVLSGTWGNCRRGCPPAYLNKNGFCSPACELGAPRGEFVTLALESPHPSDIDGLWRI